MLLLIVDTAGPTGGVLLARWDGDILDRAVRRSGTGTSDNGIEILSARNLQPRAFSAQLIPAIAELFQASDLLLTDVDAFAIVSGPGSFTGLRVGLSAVKAMAEATGKPIIALSRLAIMVSMAARFQPHETADAPMHSVLDAGRGEFYHGIYRNAGEVCMTESFQTLDGLLNGIHNQPGDVVISEPTVKIALGAIARTTLREISAPTVQDALLLAVAAWQADQFQDSARVDANYLRRSDAVVVSRIEAGRATLPANPQDLRS
ncbi:MAG: tRNA (adenosine(37)-N6)-threonylcarbamoyltransferase complex dimerization subunit type 1 TsaB [Terriglobia bacterium]|nr:tRNA (adenosine(37)-N6)-threonylcarbamoyltransferase complex dimerization subunit type 1 TsaB [Terriglobia bacterium]